MPAHNHTAAIAVGASTRGDSDNPAGAAPAGQSAVNVYSSAGPDGSTTMSPSMATASIGLAGGGQPHTNIEPFTCVNFIIALQGIYPSRD